MFFGLQKNLYLKHSITVFGHLGAAQQAVNTYLSESHKEITVNMSANCGLLKHPPDPEHVPWCMDSSLFLKHQFSNLKVNDFLTMTYLW